MLERVLQHERVAVLVFLAIFLAASWAYLLLGAAGMQQMDHASMPAAAWPWTAAHAVLMAVMWMTMMAAMMLPGAAPVILLYDKIARRDSSTTSVATGLFSFGYVAVWTCFSLLAVLGQFLLEWAWLLSPSMEATSTALSGTLLIAAGSYQFSPLKRSCLRHCRSPLDFLLSHWRSGKRGAFEMGVRHGVYCVGCCWGLMLLLFAGGVMNPAWIVGLAVYIFVEKLVPGGQRLRVATGMLLVGAGAFSLLSHFA